MKKILPPLAALWPARLWQKIALGFLLLQLLLLPWSARWLVYIWHLAAHQAYIFSHRQPIDQALAQSTDSERSRKISLILQIRQFGEKLYRLPDSNTYRIFVQLPGEELGSNLTITPALSLQAVEFWFPLIGRFSYLGFFDPNLAEEWKNRYIAEDFDVYQNVIGAYSTLGYLADPVFSSYLQFSDRGLVELVLHEMAHEKLYFNDDTAFSENLAVFIGHQAARKYRQELSGETSGQQPDQEFKAEAAEFQQFMSSYRDQLVSLYSSDLSPAAKKERKDRTFRQLRHQLQKMADRFAHYQGPARLLAENQLNNAMFVQFGHYSPEQQNGFDRLYRQNCQQDFDCFFEKLQTLKDCEKKTRDRFLTEDIEIEKLKTLCRN